MTEEKGIALVTGGSGGIGEACCRALSSSGFQVAIHYNSNKDRAEKLASELPGSFALQSDLSTTEGADEIYNVLKKEHGGNLAVLVNNAGIALDNPLFSASLDEFDRTVNTNLRSVWFLTKRLSRLMIRKKTGRIINMSSVVGSTGNPTQSVYGMTKAAMDNLTKTLAKELAEHGILVNSVAPGFIQTAMTDDLSGEIKETLLRAVPLGRMGKPEEVAEVVQFLATSGAYCTGAVFHVNGGMHG